MGKASEKREARNVAIVRQHAVAMVVSTAVFAAYRLYHHAATRSWFNWLTLLVASTVYAGCYWVLSGHVALGDVELFQAGLVEYSWDLVWYTLFVQILSNFTDWAWALYVIPWAAIFYYAWTRLIYPWITRPDAGDGGAASDAAAAKKRAKLEKQQRRAKGK